jgi:HSP20 family protein
MADLSVRRGGSSALQQNDPFQMVRESMRRMQNLFQNPLFDVDPFSFLEGAGLSQFAPDFEVRESQGGLVFKADLPGVKESDVEVTVIGNRLRITGKRELEQESRGDTWYAAERAYGSFSRTFLLPEGCDTGSVDAHLDNGVLTIQLGKRQEAQPRRIQVGGGQKRTIEGQYSQGPFHQSQPPASGQAGTQGASSGGGSPGQGSPEPSGASGYGAMYGRPAEAAGQQGQAAASGYDRDTPGEPARAGGRPCPDEDPDR